MVEKLGVRATDVHLIGHSLGAHTAGYAGESIPNLGQITGLDPAGPYFHGLPSFARLDHTDANFVDAVHSNGASLGFGILESLGHLDFRPNGGTHQPGCHRTDFQSIWNDPTAFVSDASACDHLRAVHFYSEALIPTDCKTVAYECSDYESFNNGRCTSCGSDNTKCALFGLEATNFPTRSRKNVNLYFKTGGDFPYCRYKYLIKLNLGKPRNAKPKIYGALRLSINGHTGILPNIQMPTAGFEHGKGYQFLATDPSNVAPVNKVNLRWFPVLTNLFDPTCLLGLCDKRMYVQSVTISLLNSYPDANKIANTFENCPVYGPAAVGPFFNTELSVTNNCSPTFSSLALILTPGRWFTYKR
ncbi:pancreatic lipase-related protein 3-like [Daphnia carinata]|uniref:pancreatic lipase-related protein 3-like n=1 Tax=Daphnia carinata TaxID=120202 RepID=UPI0028696D62|nr:pancreatic lipase-related protein 3-like [Daphnia carinata]